MALRRNLKFLRSQFFLTHPVGIFYFKRGTLILTLFQIRNYETKYLSEFSALPLEASLGFSMLTMDTLQTKCGEAKVRPAGYTAGVHIFHSFLTLPWSLSCGGKYTPLLKGLSHFTRP